MAASRAIFTFAAGKSKVFVKINGISRITAKYVLPTCIAQRDSFHTSSKALTQQFVLEKDRTHGSQHWMTERVVAVGLLGMIPLGTFYHSPAIDHCLAVLLPLHSYWGVKAIINDYMWRPAVPVAKLSWMLVCVLTTAGLMYLNVYDVGICKFVGMLMTL